MLAGPGKSSAALAAVVLAALTAGCSSPSRPQGSEEHSLPRLPELGTAVIPGGFEGYEEETAPYASRHPIHVDTAFFEFEPSSDFGGNHHCRAQLTVSPYDAQVATPQAYVGELSTKLCDAQWFGSDRFEWRQDDEVPGLWTVEFEGTDVGWFGTDQFPAVAAVLFVPDREFVVGVWAREDVYSLDEAVTVARGVAESVG